jgi:hypothetical protein
MSSSKIAEYYEVLPMDDKKVVDALVERLLFYWDPEFVKLTPLEKGELELAEQEGETISFENLALAQNHFNC